jgi:hypothetical protein
MNLLVRERVWGRASTWGADNAFNDNRLSSRANEAAAVTLAKLRVLEQQMTLFLLHRNNNHAWMRTIVHEKSLFVQKSDLKPVR